MKKIIALTLLLAMLVSLFGCSEQMTPAENFLLGLKSLDFATMKAQLLPDEKTGSFYTRFDDYETALDEKEKTALSSLYALLQYGIGESNENSKTEKIVSVTIKAPDVQKLISLIEPKLLVSGDSVSAILSDMIEDGTVGEKYMIEKTVDVHMTKTEDGWRMSYDDNEALATHLGLSELFRFFMAN